MNPNSTYRLFQPARGLEVGFQGASGAAQPAGGAVAREHVHEIDVQRVGAVLVVVPAPVALLAVEGGRRDAVVEGAIAQNRQVEAVAVPGDEARAVAASAIIVKKALRWLRPSPERAIRCRIEGHLTGNREGGRHGEHQGPCPGDCHQGR